MSDSTGTNFFINLSVGIVVLLFCFYVMGNGYYGGYSYDCMMYCSCNVVVVVAGAIDVIVAVLLVIVVIFPYELVWLMLMLLS